MSSSHRTYWLIAAGDELRDYSEVFTRFGIMLVGSGDLGNYFENQKDYEEFGEHTVPRFAKEVQPGDVVILKRGVISIIATGIVDKRKDSYFYNKIFSDVEDFSLQHGRYVTWYKPEKEVKTKGLARGTLTRTNNPHIHQIAEHIINENKPIHSIKIPPLAKDVVDEELISHLIEHGLSSGQAEDVIRAFSRIRRLGRWYEDHWKEREDVGEDISEHETRTFLIIPLLLALGWPEQRLKIEWKRLDITFFEKNYSPGDSPMMILESKKLYHPLLEAVKQVKNYSEKFPNCKKLVTSNGIRYLLFAKENNKWKLKAYLNLLKILDRHPYYVEIGGAQDLLTQLIP